MQNTQGGGKRTQNISRKFKGKRALVKLSSRWEENIEMNLKKN